MADCKEVLKKALFIAVPIVILLAIIGGLLGGSAKDLHAVGSFDCRLTMGLRLMGIRISCSEIRCILLEDTFCI